MKHYIQTRCYATAPEAPLIGDNDSKDTTEKQREANENSKGVRETSDCRKKLAIFDVGASSKHVCEFVWGTNINNIQYVIFQLSQPLARNTQHIIKCL